MTLTLIAGPCVIESADLCFRIAEVLAQLQARLAIDVVFKASFDKANRSSGSSFRGPGLEPGLTVLEQVHQRSGLALLTDVHACDQVEPVAQVVDVLQIPAFLCRQTDLVHACGSQAKRYGRAVNVKKAPYMAAVDMAAVRDKLRHSGVEQIWLTERGSSFGYHDLVVDFRNLPQLQQLGCRVIFDATHAVQQPGSLGECSGGLPQYSEALAAAAAAVGIDGLFLEVHPEPRRGLSDASTMLALDRLEPLLERVLRIRQASLA